MATRKRKRQVIKSKGRKASKKTKSSKVKKIRAWLRMKGKRTAKKKGYYSKKKRRG